MGRYVKQRTFGSFQNRLVLATESMLTRRKRRAWRKSKKQKVRSPVLRQISEWLNAFAFAVVVVFFLNQYALQAYTVPTGSMKPTVDEYDRLFFDKFSYGPELLPGLAKLPGIKSPARNDIIIFENPLYLSKGPVYNVIGRILYMMSFSLINIDRDDEGQPRNQYLLKRAVGIECDVISTDFSTGELIIRAAGSPFSIQLNSVRFHGIREYTPDRRISSDEYSTIRRNARSSIVSDSSMRLPGNTFGESAGSRLSTLALASDVYDYWQIQALRAVFPSSRQYRTFYGMHVNGIYVPSKHILPIGDNRDNSKDGRYFGPIEAKGVLGTPILRYWPLARAGRVK